MRQFIGLRTGDGEYYCYIVEFKKRGFFSNWKMCKILDDEVAAREFINTKPDEFNIDKPMQIYP